MFVFVFFFNRNFNFNKNDCLVVYRLKCWRQQASRNVSKQSIRRWRTIKLNSRNVCRTCLAMACRRAKRSIVAKEELHQSTLMFVQIQINQLNFFYKYFCSEKSFLFFSLKFLYKMKSLSLSFKNKQNNL